METVRILEVKQSVFANNDAQADKLRQELKEKGIYLLNLMSSPGSGKTTTLTRLIAALQDDLKIGVMEAERQADGWEAAVIGNTITLLTLMGRSIQERTASVLKAEKPELLNEVLSYIELHLNEKITLEETAKHFYVSVSTITQLFRQKMGTSFYRCVTQRRLIAAKVRIGDGEALEDVSRAVGFSDYSSFYRAFKKEYGITPRQYTQL